MSEYGFAPDSMGAAALDYAGRGVKVFPLWWLVDGHCACSDGPDCASPGKHPRTGRGGVHLATADGKRVALWWAQWPEANIGVPAGANALAIIDVDPGKGGDDTLATLVGWCQQKHGIDLMATRLVRSGSGGLHLYYRAPFDGIKSASRSFGAPGVDTRGRGGYVVAPPSRHASGGRYELIENGFAIARWPAVLSRLMEPRQAAPATRDGTEPARPVAAGGSWAQAALVGECDQLRAMTSAGSGRNDALNVAAYKLGRRVGAGLLDERAVAEALYEAASGWQGHGERALRATIASGLRAGIARPHGGPTTSRAGAAQ